MQTRKIDLVLNKLLKAQYQGTTPNADELYLVTDDAGITSADVVNALGYTPGTVKSVNNTSPDGSGNVSITVGDTLPSQSGQSGKYLTTDGTSTSWGTPTAVNYDNITNCLTEIPQDIKLELSSGTLTLKAGSKVYVPNGSGVFDTVTFASDTNVNASGVDGECFVYLNNNGAPTSYIISSFISGSTAPSSGYKIWYDTTNNIIKRYNGSTLQDSGSSFPIAKATVSGGQFTSIDQVFNGFGYVGSSVFALPGVKGLIPNGRNADGTLKNISFENTTVKTADLSNGNRTLIIQNDGQLIGYLDTAYYEDENIIKNSSGDIQLVCYLGHVIVESGAITRFETKSAFHALDYSDSPTIAGWAMPSSRYIDLTLGSSGATYTAPANGWFVLSKAVNATQQYILFLNSTNGMRSDNYNNRNNNTIGAFLPCKKGDIVSCSYSAGGATSYFRFVYAEGENV